MTLNSNCLLPKKLMQNPQLLFPFQRGLQLSVRAATRWFQAFRSTALPVHLPALHFITTPSAAKADVEEGAEHPHFRMLGAWDLGGKFYFPACALCCVNVAHSFSLFIVYDLNILMQSVCLSVL